MTRMSLIRKNAFDRYMDTKSRDIFTSCNIFNLFNLHVIYHDSIQIVTY